MDGEEGMTELRTQVLRNVFQKNFYFKTNTPIICKNAAGCKVSDLGDNCRMEGFFTGEKDRGRPRKKPEREKEGNDAGSSPRSIGLGCCCTLNLLELSV
ncbi:PREDICTED: uncharacterized protein LOC18609488 isoform X2 [Theobroma cacao]|uniref:Uncharacterized protein LOC18609488 isoform X2 n=1 Tax=Theobroma cacao TaxID=3641 RepID=A0AB32W154_THECC|nr:PREDICTED: uncharacterized protein LOC18609488 isoform X2 [Theobroma cacao]